MMIAAYNPASSIAFGRKFGVRQAIASVGIGAVAASLGSACSADKSPVNPDGASHVSATDSDTGDTVSIGGDVSEIDVTKTPQILLEGDSLSVATVDGNYSYADLLTTMLGDQAKVVSVAVPNDTLGGMSGSLSETVSFFDPARENNIVALWGGTNDIANGVSAEDAFANYVALSEAYKAAGFRVIAMTAIQAGGVNDSPDKDATRSRFNALLRAQQDLFHGFADVGAIPALSAEDNAVTTNPSVYDPNGFHLTPEGYGMVANKIQEVLLQLASVTPSAPALTPAPEPTPTPEVIPAPVPAPPPEPPPVEREDGYVTIMSQNVLNSQLPGAGHDWENRIDAVARLIRQNNAEVVPLQEVAENQFQRLMRQLGDNYKSFPAQYRNGASQQTIVYKTVDNGKPLWELKDSGVFDIPDRRDADLDKPTRASTWVRLLDAGNGDELVLSDFHTSAHSEAGNDPGGALKRERAGHIIADWARQMKAKYADALIVAGGDINQLDQLREKDAGLNGNRDRTIPCIVGEELRAADDLQDGRGGKCPPSQARIDQIFTNSDEAKGFHYEQVGQSDHAALLVRLKRIFKR